MNPMAPPPTLMPNSLLSTSNRSSSLCTLRLQQAGAARHVRTEAAAGLAADRDADEHVGHERGDVAVLDEVEVVVIRFEELRRVGEVGFPADDPGAHPADGCAPAQMRGAVTVGARSGIATEPGADVRREQPVGAGRRWQRAPATGPRSSRTSSALRSSWTVGPSHASRPGATVVSPARVECKRHTQLAGQ